MYIYIYICLLHIYIYIHTYVLYVYLRYIYIYMYSLLLSHRTRRCSKGVPEKQCMHRCLVALNVSPPLGFRV